MKRFIPFMKSDPLVAVVRLQGAIMANPRGAGLSDQAIAPAIERAFKKGKPVAVALAINSPGGSPAQSSLIAVAHPAAGRGKGRAGARLRGGCRGLGRLLAGLRGGQDLGRQDLDPRLHRRDFRGFGFHEAIAKIGVERRVHTAGESKSILDPFRPEKAEDVERLKALQAELHETFIDHVKSSRGDRLQDHPGAFHRRVLDRQQVGRTGAADGIGHLVPKMKELFGDKTRFAVYGQKRSLFGRFGLSLASESPRGWRSARPTRGSACRDAQDRLAVPDLHGRARHVRAPAPAQDHPAQGGLPKPRLCKSCGRYNLRGGPCPHCSEGQG
jgi:ClpP class serine protease